jgi:hypothetical protein
VVVLQLDYGPLCTLVILYFLLACYTSGMAQASGIMVPSLLIGGTPLSSRILAQASPLCGTWESWPEGQG